MEKVIARLQHLLDEEKRFDTTSGGVPYSDGYKDGYISALEKAIAEAKHISRGVQQ